MDGVPVSGWMSLLDLERPQAVFTLLLSVLIPLSIFVGRRNVRVRRLRMLSNLQKLLFPEGAGQNPPPGFEIIRARYLDGEDLGRWRYLLSWLQEIAIYVLPTAVLVLVSACGFGLLVQLGRDWLPAALVLLRGLHVEDGNAADYAAATGLIMGAGFVGAYIWSVNYLILRIANFDLSPLSFLSTSAHILLTVFVAWVLRQVAGVPAPDGIAVAVLLGIVFLSGLYPLLGVNVLIDRLPNWLRFKRDIAEAGQIGRSFPLDLIDGIDTSIKFRLDELDIGDVQNLATANPVELFVQTPYGFAQILDWMAQAQLLTELGPQRFLDARGRGVRDIAALLDLGDQGEAGRALLKPLLADGDETDAALQARLAALAAKLHVRHLAYWRELLTVTIDAPRRADPRGGDAAKIAVLRATS